MARFSQILLHLPLAPRGRYCVFPTLFSSAFRDKDTHIQTLHTLSLTCTTRRLLIYVTYICIFECLQLRCCMFVFSQVHLAIHFAFLCSPPFPPACPALDIVLMYLQKLPRTGLKKLITWSNPTISFIKKERFKPSLKSREGIRLLRVSCLRGQLCETAAQNKWAQSWDHWQQWLL